MSTLTVFISTCGGGMSSNTIRVPTSKARAALDAWFAEVADLLAEQSSRSESSVASTGHRPGLGTQNPASGSLSQRKSPKQGSAESFIKGGL
jgi:hypothetical protein